MKIEEIFPTKAKIIEIFLTDNYLVAEKEETSMVIALIKHLVSEFPETSLSVKI